MARGFSFAIIYEYNSQDEHVADMNQPKTRKKVRKFFKHENMIYFYSHVFTSKFFSVC